MGMITRLCNADDASVREAADILKAGGLVAFPTETVYGLGANAFDASAVLSVFTAKGRPADNPLIVHIHDRNQLDEICDIPLRAPALMDAFWPGPLTILFPRKSVIPDVVTAGLSTVAVRKRAACCGTIGKSFRKAESDYSDARAGRYERDYSNDYRWRGV